MKAKCGVAPIHTLNGLPYAIPDALTAECSVNERTLPVSNRFLRAVKRGLLGAWQDGFDELDHA
jgi:hypothetical protein